jgi:hypothetical protein
MFLEGNPAQLFELLLFALQLRLQIVDGLCFLRDLQIDQLLEGPIPLEPHLAVLLGEEGDHLPELLSDAAHLP